MSIGYKITAIVLLILGMFVALDYAAMRQAIYSTSSKLEQDDADRNAKRLINTFNDEIEGLVRSAADWAEWDLTYQYMLDHNDDYIKDNYLPVATVFQNLQVDLIFIIDTKGKLVWGEVNQSEKNKSVTIFSMISPIEKFLQHFSINTRIKHNENGIILTNQGPMLIASSPILTNSGSGPMRGSLIQGKLLKGNVSQKIMEDTQLGFKYWSIEKDHKLLLKNEKLKKIPKEGELITQLKNENILSVYFYMPYLYGEGGVLFRINTVRKISNAGNETMQLVSLINAIIIVVVMVLLFLLLRYIITEPLRDLRNKIADIEINPELNGLSTNKLSSGRKGEIDALAKEFDQLLENISDRSNKLQFEIDEQKKVEEQLSYNASHDSLTGLVNRRELERRTERLLTTSQNNKEEHALCFLDLDQFKIVNDTCGHAAGDELLRQLGVVLNEKVRQRDTLARLGGDEFGVLMEHCSLGQAHRVADSLLKAIQDYQFVWEGHSFRLGVSIGLVAITESISNMTELLKQADIACYAAKDQGRNRIHVYRIADSSKEQSHGEAQWVTRIIQALDENKFLIYAQPIISLDGDRSKHYEFLLRMEDDHGNIILPGAFLPAAERYKLISRIDYWVVENSLKLLAGSPEFLNEINFCSINLSGGSITSNNFLDFIIEQLGESKVDGKKICFEITETDAISSLSEASKFISTLKKVGCRFALDDFGSGLSSFGYLKNLDVDYLKIDGMFVRDIASNPINHAMVKSINDIGHVMNIQTIAEFVENNDIKNELENIGVNYAQGYGVGKPQLLKKFL